MTQQKLEHAQQILRNIFGYQDFRLNQQAIISDLLEGKDVLALMPTGGGKSLCYQIPALVREGVGVVVSPLIALMQDQVDALRQLNINAAFINSTMSGQEVNEVERQISSGELDILYVAPERLLMPSCLAMLSRVQVSLFAIDEAHCVSQWGHDFRPEYQQLFVLAERFPGVPRIALTATADENTREEIVNQLALQQANRYINSFDRANIHYSISEAPNSQQQLWQFIDNNHAEDSGIVYCLSRKKVDATAKWLCQQGRIALPYHAGLSADMRQNHQQRFLRESSIIIVATIAFGMGIDKPDVRFVAHLSLPKSIEAYYQETGRAGRDGEPAAAWMAYGLQDVISLRQMIEQNNASQQFKRISGHKLDAMLGLCETIGCRRQTLLGYFGEELSAPCGHCDNCNTPPETWDATEAARKALSTIYRSDQRFGVSYLTDILLGKATERILNNGHEQLSTFGIGADLNANQWKSLFRQLIAMGYARVDHEYGAIKLEESSRPLLRNETQLQARKLTKKQKGAKQARSQSTSSVNQPLLDALKAWRKETALEQAVPPYVIFHDKTLVDIADIRPEKLSELRLISGVGEQKLENYGSTVLGIVQDHPAPEGVNAILSDTINSTLSLLAQGHDIAETAIIRKMTEGTVYKHLEQAIQAGNPDLLLKLPIDDDDLKTIRQALEAHADETTGFLRQVFESMDGAYDYSLIRCVAAAT